MPLFSFISPPVPFPLYFSVKFKSAPELLGGGGQIGLCPPFKSAPVFQSQPFSILSEKLIRHGLTDCVYRAARSVPAPTPFPPQYLEGLNLALKIPPRGWNIRVQRPKKPYNRLFKRKSGKSSILVQFGHVIRNLRPK